MVLVNKMALQSRFLNQLTSSIGITPKMQTYMPQIYLCMIQATMMKKTFINFQPHTNN